MLMSPGSSLGGARPKASVVDDNNQLWSADIQMAEYRMVKFIVPLQGALIHCYVVFV